MNCPSCQHKNPETAKFCMSCGDKMEKKCSNCGTGYIAQSKFCMECGKSLSSPKVLVSASNPKTKNAERRQLTVMFCGIVGSTEISNQLNAEEFRQLLLDYQQVAKKVITRYEGYIAQYLDNGLVVYFGYPKGLEGAPKAAIRCGLGMHEALLHANQQWKAQQKKPLALRIGIHTGLVVVDYHLALGDTTNIAARIEKLAPPDSVVISHATHRLVDGWFETTSLGHQNLKGIAEPLEIFQVNQSSGARSRLEIAMAKGLTPMVGRDEELQMLKRAWQQAYNRKGQIVILNGEAGIGKSRLVESVKQDIVVEADAWMIEVRCSAHHQNTVFYPILDLLEGNVLKFEAEDTQEVKSSKLEGFILQSGLSLDNSMPLLTEFLSLPLPPQYAPSQLSASGKKKQIMEAILRTLINRSLQQPVLLIIEDLHWADPSTLEWINLFVDQLPTYPIFALCTARPEFQPSWLGRSHAVQLQLQGLSTNRVESICQHQSHGKPLPVEVMQQIKEKTDGIPLFVEELTRMVLDSGMLIEKEDAYELNGPLPILAIPSTLQDSLLARLDQLDSIKELAQIGSVLGREFSFHLLQSVSGRTTENLEKEIALMIEAELVYQRGMMPQATFIFKHALIQDTAYNSLLKSRRQLLHQRIAQVLEQEFEEMIKNRPEILAHHLTEADLQEKAIESWQAAGLLAIKRHALLEGVHHLRKGLALLPRILDESQRLSMELTLLKILTPNLQLSQGYANKEIEKMANRWLEVAKQSGTIDQIYDALVGQFTYYTFSGNYEKGKPIVLELATLAKQRKDPYYESISRFFQGIQDTLSGNYKSAQEQFIQGIELYQPEVDLHRSYYNIGNIKSTTLTYYSTALHLLGYPKKALQNVQEASDLAFSVNHPGSIYASAAFMSRLYLARQDYTKIEQVVAPALNIAKENGDTFIIGLLSYYLSLSHAHRGNEPAVYKAHQIANSIYKVYKSYRPAFLVYIADACRKLGKVEMGMEIIKDSFKHIYHTGEKLYHPELYRVKGDLLVLQQKPLKEIEGCYEKALSIAQSQEDRWHELLAAKSLAQLWMKNEKVKEAKELLLPIFEAFPEKNGLIDLQETQDILQKLASI